MLGLSDNVRATEFRVTSKEEGVQARVQCEATSITRDQLKAQTVTL
jgi:hypothetical protein